VRALQQPILVAGRACSVGAAVGMAVYPDHGDDAQALLQRASAQAGSVATVGAAGFAGLTQREPGGSAANDETPG
jgi:predicted signal transduction protein with EAL and GGDEF domain